MNCNRCLSRVYCINMINRNHDQHWNLNDTMLLDVDVPKGVEVELKYWAQWCLPLKQGTFKRLIWKPSKEESVIQIVSNQFNPCATTPAPRSRSFLVKMKKQKSSAGVFLQRAERCLLLASHMWVFTLFLPILLSTQFPGIQHSTWET